MFRTGSWATASILTIAAATAAASVAALGLSRCGTTQRERPRVAKAKGRDSKSDQVYPPHRYPGARDVVTPFGTIKVFEWGPEDGEKVLLMQGIGTPSLGYAGIANELVANGYRVMTFDYFGRGHSDSPIDLPHDIRLYLSQLLLVLASSHLSWTGDAAFHLFGYSLGGGLAASIAAYYPHMLRSLTIVCPSGLVRSTTQLSFVDRILYSGALLPDWLLRWVMRRRLDPGKGGKDVPVEFEGGKERMPTWDDMMRWQLNMNEGFIASYLSTFQHAPIYDQHEREWQTLRGVLSQRRIVGDDVPPGLVGGRLCIILGEDDVYMNRVELVTDAMDVLGENAVTIHVMEGGHEIAIARGADVARLAIQTWTENEMRG